MQMTLAWRRGLKTTLILQGGEQTLESSNKGWCQLLDFLMMNNSYTSKQPSEIIFSCSLKDNETTAKRPEGESFFKSYHLYYFSSLL